MRTLLSAPCAPAGCSSAPRAAPRAAALPPRRQSSAASTRRCPLAAPPSPQLAPPQRARAPRRACGVRAATAEAAVELPPLTTHFWKWRDYDIRYTAAGDSGPALVLVHGFGGNADHWRKNTAALAACGMRVFAIDLLGFGFSSKPTLDTSRPASLLNFETWGAQLRDFIADVAGGAAFVASNSVGGIASLQAAADDAAAGGRAVRGVVLLDVSLRELHLSKQLPLARPLIKAFQDALRTTPLGRAFFGQVARADAVRAVLREAYGDASAVTDELVDVILKPGLQPGAAPVFLDFISYSSGPLAEQLLPRVACPVTVGWGVADPWERIEKARLLYAPPAPNVEAFIELPGVGHCPQDEAPQLVNPLIADFVRRHAGGEMSTRGV